MKCSHLYMAQLALATSALAADINSLVGTGPGPTQSGSPDWQALNRDPKATKMERLSSGWGIATEADGGKAPTNPLTWRINITEATVSDASNASGPVPNARMLNTVYDLSWEGGRTLEDTMESIQQDAQPSNNQSGSPQLCATIFTNLFPANVTNAYNDAQGDNCQNALGNCLAPLLALDGASSSDGCPSPKPIDSIPACDGVFGNNTAYTTMLLTDPGDGSNSTFPLRSGSAFFFQSSEPYEAGNTTYFDQQDLRLHMMILNTVSSTTRAVCSRVNSSVEAKDMSTGASDDEGAAMLGYSTSLWTVGVAVFGVLAFVL